MSYSVLKIRYYGEEWKLTEITKSDPLSTYKEATIQRSEMLRVCNNNGDAADLHIVVN
jgi:hypothetical protein